MAYSSITKPTDYFNTVLYNGTGSSNSVTGVGFQPDWTWIKQRNGTTNHFVYDGVRGVQQTIYTDATSAEATQSQGLTAFGTDGFTVGTNTGVNGAGGTGGTYVAWNWLGANGTASNSNGSITTTVSANTTAGFSIVTYTLGSGTGSTTQGHGLGAVPHVIINKPLDQTYNWQVYHHKNTSAPETERLLLNDSAATEDNNKPWNDTAPTSSVFTHGDSSWNGTGDHVAYCFTEKQGYSKFGSYTGNGSTDGTFVYTGFKPAWLLIKRSDGGTDNWNLYDNKRLGYNTNYSFLIPNETNAENTTTSTANLDILSNGFKIRGSTGHTNTSGGTYIYMAFAENPFVGNDSGTAVPVVAR